jgi:general secretion pathway protein E
MEQTAKTRQTRPADRLISLRQVLEGLIRDGMITADQAKPLIATQRRDSDEHPLESVARRKWTSAQPPHELLDLERLTRWLARKAAVPYVRIDPLKIDTAAVTSLVSYPYAERFQILPLAVEDNHVTIATAQPFVREWERELGPLLRMDISRVVANPADIKRYLKEFYSVSRSIRGASAAEAATSSGILNLEQLVELGRTDQLEPNDRHVVNLVDWLLQYAFEQRASDIHLEPRREKSYVRFRIDGVLHTVNELPTVVMSAVTSRVKALGRMDLVERRRPQDGRLKTKTPAGREVELRLSTMPTAFGEKLVLRIFDPEVLRRSFEQLGLSQDDSERWRSMLEQPHGIILVTGPTGSGKTTTLYSALRKLARPEVNVCTIEDPIEMVEPNFNQMQVQPNIGVDFAGGVRNLLRQDPDIIMVGEVRDKPTAEMAIQAALTGHLVFSTLHTNDAPSAITRLLDVGAPPYLIKATLLGIVAQRLVRTLCPHCKKPVASAEFDWGPLVPPDPLPDGAAMFLPNGCDECRHTGYRGRIGIYEIVTMSPELRRMVTADTDVALIRRQAINEGMHTLRQSGARKIALGLTTVSEVVRVAMAEAED